jgi:hypothetical protein
MSERFNEAVLKTVEGHTSGGSNPSLSADLLNNPVKAGYFYPANRVSLVRRDARVVEWDGLENRCMGNCTEGSNPSLSANLHSNEIISLQTQSLRAFLFFDIGQNVYLSPCYLFVNRAFSE